MKKAIFSLPLVIPLVSIMPAPAVAHFCCCAALAPTVPAENPSPPPGAKVGDPCRIAARAWKNAYCASSAFGVVCATTTQSQSQTLFHYVVTKDFFTGQLYCKPAARFEETGDLQVVAVCTDDSQFCSHSECVAR
jgi:hypothetical protein